MIFKKIADQAQEKAAGIAAAAQEKIDVVIDEFNRFMPFAEELGLRMSSFNIEAGLLPEVRATLIGSIDSINNQTIEKIIAENENNKLLIAILNVINMAFSIHARLEGVYISVLKDLVIDIKLGVPPSISCSFQ
jgi:hemoglobin-like flavoprotein